MAVAAGQRNRLGKPVGQQHAVGQVGQEVVLRQVDGLLRHRPRLVHVFEHDHRAEYVPALIVDRRGRILDGRLEPVATDEEAVRGQTDDPVELYGPPHRVQRGFPCRPVDDSEDLGERPAQRLLARPPGHAFGHGIEVGHVGRHISAEHAVADRVEREVRAPPPEEQGLGGRPAR